MAVTFPHSTFSPPSVSLPRSSLPRFSPRCSSSASIPMDPQNGGRRAFMEFPYVSAPHRDLMVELVSTVENRLDPYLLPCKLPPDVQYYENQSGTAHAALQVRSGIQSSQIDFILGSWLHCELPTGAALNITSLSGYLNSSTDAPNFLIELIQSSPTSLVLILDLPPRKDLVLHDNYLKTFYEDTQMDTHRQNLSSLPEAKPYFSSSLYIRSVVSPTAILVRVEADAGKNTCLEEIVRDHVAPVAKEVLRVWLDVCACGERVVGEAERECLAKRDGIIKRKTIEIDLASSFPRLFGQEVANRVLEALQEVFIA
ncbi:hypothetical protein LguiA_017555 [Lonicera macranthoides]